MTKFTSEAEYLQFKDKLRSIIIKIIIGFVIGFIFGLWMESGILGGVIFGILFAGMPYAWSVIPVLAIGWAALAGKFIVALFLGWIITPISLIYNLIQMNHYKKSVMQNVLMEEEIRAEDIRRENANVDKIVDAINAK